MYKSALNRVHRRCEPVRTWLAEARLAEQELHQALRKAAGVSLMQFIVLQALHFQDGRMPMTRLAEAVGISKSRLTHTVETMETPRWVHREPDIADGRGIQAVLTVLGAEALVRAVPVYIAAIANLRAAPLGERQRAELQVLGAELAEHAAAPVEDRDPAPTRRIA